MNRCALSLVALLLAPALLLAADAGIIAPGAKLEKVSSEFKFTEGPTRDKEGNVYFVDQPNDRIMKWNAADGKIETFMQPSGRSNGMCFDNAGQLISCADEKNELWAIDVKTKQVTVLVKEYNGKLLNGPNDVWVHPSGSMYFTDPMYKRPWWKRDPAPQQDVQGVYVRSADGKTVKRLIDDLKQPNGIIGTPDGMTLYIEDIGAKKTYQYTIKEDGSLADKKVLTEVPAGHKGKNHGDGVTLDDKGNLYTTGNGVIVFDKTGKEIAHIEVPGGWTANVCFAGKDNDTLFITASASVYTLKMAVKGAGSQ